MEKLVKKYSDKLIEHRLCEEDAPLVAGLDADLVWNRKDSMTDTLAEIFRCLNINSLIFSKPKEPYFSIINYLSNDVSVIEPEDCETRTFLHSIPVIHEFKVHKIVKALKNHKCVVIKDYGIVTYGTVSPEQAFVVFSSVCFACYVKFFRDYYYDSKNKIMTSQQQNIFETSINFYKDFMDKFKGKNFVQIKDLNNSEQVIQGMDEAGKLIVACGLVDSFFGNISFRLKDTIYISETGSSLDELLGCIDACPIDNSSCTGITASSELSAHKDIYLTSDVKVILHGHPKFSVVMSMICDDRHKCVHKDECHIKCPKQRFINDIPVVSGEVGTGQYGLCNTLPPAIKSKRGAIVYGHGLFTISNNLNFVEAFSNMLDIEYMCMEKFVGND
ncbi:class II aldolase/adducin family protein [bacterium]